MALLAEIRAEQEELGNRIDRRAGCAFQRGSITKLGNGLAFARQGAKRQEWRCSHEAAIALSRADARLRKRVCGLIPFDRNVAVHSQIPCASMQINFGLRSILAVPWAYSLAMRLLRNGANERWFIDHVLALRTGEKVVDVGCGPADILGESPPSNTWVWTSVNPTSIGTLSSRSAWRFYLRARRRLGARPTHSGRGPRAGKWRVAPHRR